MESPSRMERRTFRDKERHHSKVYAFLIFFFLNYNHLYYFPTNPELAMTLIASLALPFQIETYGAPKVDWILSFLLN